MKIVFDNNIIKLLGTNDDKIQHNPSLFNADNYLSFKWPSLFEYLEHSSVLSILPEFDQNQPLFKACISILCTNDETEALCQLYDLLFKENLIQIKALPEINSSFLLQAIKERRQQDSLEVQMMLSSALAAYKTSLTEKASHTMHDLILYLAWDRMCVCMARLFDYQSTDPKFIKGIGILKDCLIESYQHISRQGRTIPGIYRMLEAFLFYQMREENLEKHNADEWTILTQSFQALKEQDKLADFFYIDDGIYENELKIEEDPVYYVTLDSPAKVNARLALAQYMINKLKGEIPNWGLLLSPKKIVYI